MFKQKKKTSPAIARNVGIAFAKGQYIAFCDCDDLFDKNKIIKQVYEMLNNKNAVLTYTDAVLMDGSGKVIGYAKTMEWDLKTWIKKRYITFSSIMTYRDAILKIGGFNNYYTASEDLDLLIRLAKIAPFKRIPELLTFHRIHPNSISAKKLKVLKNTVIILLNSGFIKQAFYELYK